MAVLFPHFKSVHAVHMKGTVTVGAFTRHLHAHIHTSAHTHARTPDGASAKRKAVFRLPGFHSSKGRNSISCHKQVDSSGKEMSGLKNEQSNAETSFDKSCLCLTLLSALQGHIRGTRLTLMGLILFRHAANSTSVSIEIQFTICHAAGMKSNCCANLVDLRFLKPCEEYLWFPLPGYE